MGQEETAMKKTEKTRTHFTFRLDIVVGRKTGLLVPIRRDGYMLGTEGTSMSYARVISVIAITTLLHTPTLAQPVSQWPDRPVRLLVPVGAGGAADTLSRNLSSGFA